MLCSDRQSFKIRNVIEAIILGLQFRVLKHLLALYNLRVEQIHYLF